jgi:hypothetical protein
MEDARATPQISCFRSKSLYCGSINATDRKQIEHLSHHPLRLIRDIWQWEWHALIVWGVVAAILMPLLAMCIRRALVLLMRHHRTLIHSRPALH